MNELTYSRQGEYFIPDLISPEETEVSIGRYALLHQSYLEQHKKVFYYSLLTTGKLNRYLHEIEQVALTRLALLINQLAKEQDVTESLKEEAPLQWLSRMNNIRNQAEESILSELIYS